MDVRPEVTGRWQRVGGRRVVDIGIEWDDRFDMVCDVGVDKSSVDVFESWECYVHECSIVALKEWFIADGDVLDVVMTGVEILGDVVCDPVLGIVVVFG